MHNLPVSNIRLRVLVKFVHKLFNSKKKFVGILGGTFDPPHNGHIFISKFAKVKLDLGEIWWVVTPSNPLKKTKSDYKKRLLNVKRFLKSKDIKVFEVEDKKNHIYTIDLIEILYKKYPDKKFVWLMGVDNLKEFHLWKNWREIFYNIPIAIFDRPFYSLDIARTKAISYFKGYKINNRLSKELKFMKAPSWVFISGLTNLQSSTKIRSKKIVGKKN